MKKSKAFLAIKIKRNQYHQTNFTTKVQGTYLHSQEIKEKKKIYKNKHQTIKKMAIGMYISIITLNVNGLNASTKRHRLAEWIQKQDPYTCCLQEIHFRPKDTYSLKVRGWKNIFHANGKQESCSSNCHVRQNRT